MSFRPRGGAGSSPRLQGTELVHAFSKCGGTFSTAFACHVRAHVPEPVPAPVRGLIGAVRGGTLAAAMVAGLAFLATAVATVFAQATGVRYSRSRAPYQGAWTFALALFALASAALATAASTGWDQGTFRVFFLLGALLNVPWLALGTVYLIAGRRVGDRVRAGLLVFTGVCIGVMFATPIHGVIAPFGGIPVGKDHFGALPRVLAGVGSGVGALVVFGGAVSSAVRFARRRAPGPGPLAAGNALIALGTLVLSSGGLLQGVIGQDQAFVISLAAGIVVIYAGFVVASSGVRPVATAGDGTGAVADDPDSDDESARRTSLPASVRGSASTTSTRVGSL
jgi:MFS family permease